MNRTVPHKKARVADRDHPRAAPRADDFWADCFHRCALAAGLVAHAEGWLHDSERVKRLAYQWYEEALREKNANRAGARRPTTREDL